METTNDLTNNTLEEEIAGDVKPKRKPYNENAALKRAQQRYYEKNKEEKLKHNKEYRKTWLASKDIEELREKHRESCRRYYHKNKQLKEIRQEPETITVEDEKTAQYMDLFDEIFGVTTKRINFVNGRIVFNQSSE